MAKRALVTGVTGQDGSYLTEFLLAKGYEVHGLMRRASLFKTDRIDHLYHDPHLGGARRSLHYGDLTDGTGSRRVLEAVDPDEVYNLGAQSHVKVSFDIPEYTAEVVAIGTLRLSRRSVTTSNIEVSHSGIAGPADHVWSESRRASYALACPPSVQRRRGICKSWPDRSLLAEEDMDLSFSAEPRQGACVVCGLSLFHLASRWRGLCIELCVALGVSYPMRRVCCQEQLGMTSRDTCCCGD
jgi:hypothetical protein